MPDKDASTPQVYLVRHGETEWTKNGRYTGTTELPLTETGIQQVLSTSNILIGPSKLISPSRLARIYVSPRLRAQQTFHHLFSSHFPLSDADLAEEGKSKIITTDALAEWDYGAYEGLLTKEIREGRKERGLDKEREWDIWRDGCEGGEEPEEVSARIDGLIGEIKEVQGRWMRGEREGEGGGGADVLLVSHGHLLRAFAKRWLGYPLEMPLAMMLEPGGVGVLSYAHHSIEEPAFFLGVGFPAAAC